MTDISRYDVQYFHLSKQTRGMVGSNLRSKYLTENNRFCGNYSNRLRNPYHYRCWRHIKKHSTVLTRRVLPMIISSGCIYNKTRWLEFIDNCEGYDVPIELVVYEESMFKCTVRHLWNFISRFWPLLKLYSIRKGVTLSIRESHA